MMGLPRQSRFRLTGGGGSRREAPKECVYVGGGGGGGEGGWERGAEGGVGDEEAWACDEE